MTDEGLGGIDVHVANDRPGAIDGAVAVALYHDRETRSVTASIDCDLIPHARTAHNVETLVGHFVECSWAYRFGPPAQDARGRAARHDRRATRAPAVAGGPLRRSGDRGTIERGRSARPERERATITDRCRRAGHRDPTLRHGVRVDAPGFPPSDDAFSIEPGATRRIELHPSVPGSPFSGGPADRALEPRRHIAIARHDPADVTARAVQPVYLGTGSMPLRDVPRAPAGRSGETAVVLCPPWGWDEVSSYRARRAWAEDLAVPATRPCASTCREPATAAARRATPRASGRPLPRSRRRRLAARDERARAGGGHRARARWHRGRQAVSAEAAIDDLVLWAVPAAGRGFVRQMRAFAGCRARATASSSEPEPACCLRAGWR